MAMYKSARDLPLRVVVPVAVSLTVLFVLFHRSSEAYFSTASDSALNHTHATPHATPHASHGIPNYVHFVYVLENPEADFKFYFSHFLSVFAAWHLWQPTKIYFSTNAVPESIARARDGRAGKWTQRIFDMPNLIINEVEAPTHTNNGTEIKGMEHRSDFVRVKVVHDLGGVYIDFDVHALHDIRVLQQSGFNSVVGLQMGDQVNSGTFMSKKGGKMIKAWMDDMHVVYDGGWTTHSNDVISKVSGRLAAEPGEVLIMEREAFGPGSWTETDTTTLFEAHNDTSNLAGINQGDSLPSYEEGFSDRWEHPERFPKWEKDWSRTYLLHAFSPTRAGHNISGFEHIDPQYVLARQSNFARATYPVAKIMYEEGLLSLNDTHEGK